MANFSRATRASRGPVHGVEKVVAVVLQVKAQHPRQQGKMIVLDEDEGALVFHLGQDGLLHLASPVDVHIGFPVGNQEYLVIA
jgi:hypothetical protein